MTFERYFKTSSYCMIGSAFASIAATGSIDSISILSFAAVMIASLCINTAAIKQRLPAWLLNSITLAYLVFFMVDLRVLSQSFIAAAIHLLFFVAAMKLLTLTGDRDYLQLYLISLTMVLAASTLTVNFVFAVCLLLFMFFAISALILFEMRRSYTKMRETARVRPFVVRLAMTGNSIELFAPFPAGLFSITTLGITLLIVVLAVPFFFIFPRINRGSGRQPTGSTQFISGFSDRVELGQIGSIKQSDAIVMRVKTDRSGADTPQDLKWRGIAFDRFDGRSWIRTDRSQIVIPTEGHYYKLETSTQGMRWLNQTFFIEALPTNVVFAARKALAVTRDVGNLRKDSADNLYTDPHLFRKLRYSAISDPIQPNPALISDRSPIPPEILAVYLQRPAEDPRIAALAASVTRQAASRYAKARVLENYLRTNYGYSLVLRGTPGSKDPLATFLFDVRKGHCEYFASAMAMMLRSIGIPARLVNGFRAGEYNSLGDNWVVRQYHAHSWVEAYFPPYGWVELDPTPADPRGSRNRLVQFVANLTDTIDLWWWEGVINYDSSKQYGMISALFSSLERGQNEAKEWLARGYEKGRSGWAWIRSPRFPAASGRSWLLCAAAMLFAAALMVRRWRRRSLSWLQRAFHPGNSRIAAASFYRETLALLADRGIKPDQGQTPLEFAQNLGHPPSRQPVLALTHMYNSIRFGPPGMPFDRAEANTQLRLLRDSLRQSSRI
jgi:protein-glutamine gamma-glutamyltransferase